MRSNDGIVVFSILLMPQDWKDALLELGHTEDQAKEFFDWKDKQNVPKTTRLLQGLQKLAPLPPSSSQ
jgi:hypothetical protein